MSFAITVYEPEAIVMASDSRQFLTIDGCLPSGEPMGVETISSDFAFKTASTNAKLPATRHCGERSTLKTARSYMALSGLGKRP